ncbi:hypothetical protein [Paracoccus contaminans]|uniref:Uncharacterized protein n=1 Tax=Paracoccus contaminans TaxID=1945662 RepID=A0A1W6CUC2_9RHOB|nr:hypothetical protein [Paracoccus contaminans]ARJ68454.1 hypothetical protein B0A89_01110 [Paracoccus contaminans]
MSNGLPIDRTRYNPVQDVTPDEAERNKRLMGQNRAHQHDQPTGAPPAAEKEADIPDPDKASA